MEKYNVVVKAISNNEVVETITKEPISERMAGKIERGININLNHNDYYTDLVLVK